MEPTYKVEIRKPKKSRAKFRPKLFEGFEHVSDGKYAHHWEREGLTKAEAERYAKLAKRKGLAVKTVESRYARSKTYRREFIAANPGPWKCRYCGRKLAEARDMTVDHVVPVAKAGAKGFDGWVSRWTLKKLEADNVNSLRNLVAACKRCNSRKGAKLGAWPLLAWLGSKSWWWPVRTGLMVAGALAVAAAALWLAFNWGAIADGMDDRTAYAVRRAIGVMARQM